MANSKDRSERQKKMLGQPFGTAYSILKKAIMFNMAKKLGMLICYRCSMEIENVEEFSIEHKEAWESAEDPLIAFHAIENIAFSHLECNCRASRRPNKIYATKNDRYKSQWDRYYEKNGKEWNERRNERRRKPKRQLVLDAAWPIGEALDSESSQPGSTPGAASS